MTTPGLIAPEMAAKAAPYAIGLLALVAVFLYFRHAEQEIGAERVLRHAADSAHKVDSALATLAKADAAGARLEADSIRAAAREREEEAARQQRRTNQAIGKLQIERDSALAVARDSTATIPELKQTIFRLAQASDSAQRAQEGQHAVDLRALALAGRALAADSVALARQDTAYNTLLKRTLDAERLAKLGHAPASVGVKLLWLGAGAVAARLLLK